MSKIYSYICTTQTADPYLPAIASNQAIFNRDVSDALYAMQGGYQTVGRIALFPVQQSVPYHLLCDGTEVPKQAFPELFAYLADSQGTAVDPDNFVLPNLLGTITPAATATPETIVGGTVTSGTSTPGGGDSGGSTGGAVTSGGRFRKELGTA